MKKHATRILYAVLDCLALMAVIFLVVFIGGWMNFIHRHFSIDRDMPRGMSIARALMGFVSLVLTVLTMAVATLMFGWLWLVILAVAIIYPITQQFRPVRVESLY